MLIPTDNVRLTAGLLYVRFVLAVGLIVLPVFVDVVTQQISWILLLALHLIVWTAATHTGKPVMETNEAALDERELGIRNSASWWGLTVFCSLTVLFAAVLIIAAGRDGAFFNAILQRSGYILVGITLTSLTVPSVFAQTSLARRKLDEPLFVGIDDPGLENEFDEWELDGRKLDTNDDVA